MSSITKDSEPLPIISSLPKKDGRFRSGQQPANKSPSLRPELVGKRFGWVTVTSPIVVWREMGKQANGSISRFRYLHCRCASCRREKLINLDNLLRGKTKGCAACTKPRQVPKWLDKRVHAARQRCVYQRDPGYKHYGARGVQFKFESVRACCDWIMKNLSLDEDKEIDRIDNNGHYEVGNIKFSTRRQNQNNRRNTVFILFEQQPIPANDAFHVFRYLYPHVRYADHTLVRLLDNLQSPKAIVAQWHTPSCKPKGLYGTFSTPDLDIVSRYLTV